MRALDTFGCGKPWQGTSPEPGAPAAAPVGTPLVESIGPRIAQERQQTLRHVRREVREPLNALLGFVQILQRQVRGGEVAELEDSVAQIERAGLRLLDLLDGLCESAPVAGHAGLQPVHLGQALAAAMSGRQAEPMPADGPSTVWADPVLLRRALSTLLLMGGDGHPAWVRHPLPPLAGPGSGQGADPLVQLQLSLPPGWQAEPHAGRLDLLGQLQAQMGGQLWLAADDASRPCLRLAWRAVPAVDAIEPLGGAGHEGQPASALVGELLYVEDVPANVALVQHALRTRPGVRLAVARTGREALERLRNGAAPDLLLLDLMLPDISGRDVLRQLAAEGRLSGMPTVVLSAVDDPASEAELLGLGACDYLVKPLRLERLLSLVDRALAAAPARAAPISR